VIEAGLLSHDQLARFIGAPQQLVNFGEVLPHFAHLNMSAIRWSPPSGVFARWNGEA